ncbi:hypothetical protein MST27_16320 [Pseudomonas sp. PS1]|uniref:Toxin CptA n=1 Tax=Stutzerimonas marianensis TaxID=2929513 RepID=A0A9X1W625_9GAMM|nr:hypothetical protein [Pseudomonas marianensis]
MSSHTDSTFECRWRASRSLLAGYLVVQGLAIGCLLGLPVPLWIAAVGLALCFGHACWSLPRHILLTHDTAWVGLRHDQSGWALWSQRTGWQPIQLRPDSLALPSAVILSYRLPGERFARGCCIPKGALASDQHRRLRVRLKYSRRRWAAPE